VGRKEQVGGVDCHWLLYAQWRARERLPSHAHAHGSGKRCTQGRHIHTRIRTRTRTRTHTRMHAHTHARTHLRPHALAHARADTRTYFHLARESHESWLVVMAPELVMARCGW